MDLEACSTSTWRPISIFSSNMSIISKRCIFCFISWPVTLQIKFLTFYLFRVDLEACRNWTWRPILNLSSNMLITSKCFISWPPTLQIKFDFLPVQSGPEGQQNLNLEADLIFSSNMSIISQKMHILFYTRWFRKKLRFPFFWHNHVNNIHKDACIYCLIIWSRTLQTKILPVQKPPSILQHLNLKTYPKNDWINVKYCGKTAAYGQAFHRVATQRLIKSSLQH